MPVVIIAAAAATFVEGAALVAAATTIAGTVAAGAMMVGAALTIAGTVTGNDKLARWGAIIGIAGGLGSLAVGAMEGAATTAADTGGALANTSAADITSQTAGIAEGENVGSIANAAGSAAPQPSGLLPSADQAAAPQALTPPGASPPDINANVPAPSPAAATPAPGATPTATPTSTFNAPAPSTSSSFNAPAPSTTSAFQPGTQAPAPVTDMSTPAPGTGSSTGFFDSMGRWIRNNDKEIAKAGLQGASGLLTSLAPSPLNRYYAAKAGETQTATEIARQRAGLAPGWWYK